MRALRRLARLFRRAKPCQHMDQLGEVTPSSQDSCDACIELGDVWVQLRICLVCGNVGCCDNSKNKHATKHFHETGHPIIQSFQPQEGWRFCYVDQQPLPDGLPFR